MAMSDAVSQALAAVAAAEREGRIGEAAALLEGLGAAIQDRPAALHLAGVVAARQGDFARAAPLMDRAAKLGSKDGLDPAVLALVHRNRIEAHRRLLNPKAAIAAGREALAHFPLREVFGCEDGDEDAGPIGNGIAEEGAGVGGGIGEDVGEEGE